MNRLKDDYQKNIIHKIKNEFGYSNILEVPKITKISINIGISQVKEKKEFVNKVANDMYKITGQKPKICRAKHSISGFKLTQGDINGLKVTLRKKRMYQFLEKFLRVALPRARDFRGLDTRSFDQNNNFTIGIKENVIFPEISYDKIEEIYGMQITFSTDAKSKKEVISLFKNLGFPLKNINNQKIDSKKT